MKNALLCCGPYPRSQDPGHRDCRPVVLWVDYFRDVLRRRGFYSVEVWHASWQRGVLAGLLGAFMIVIFGALYALFLYGYGELIMLLISLEDNTFKTVKLLEEVTSEEPAVEEKAA